MDKWVMIIREAEDKWQAAAATSSLSARYPDAQVYRYERDKFKAQYIFDVYGYDYFLKFVERCPHISDLIKECERNDTH